MEVSSLAGEWYYSTNDLSKHSLPEYDHSEWATMHLPQNWFLGGLDHHGVVWFRRTFQYQISRSTFHSMHFQGVDYSADVYLNGVRLGSHQGYFEPFSFDITDVLRNGENILAVRVDSPWEEPGPDGWHMRKKLIKGVLNHHDCRPGGGWEPRGQSFNTGGIWNQIQILEHSAITIDNVLLKANLDQETKQLSIICTFMNRSNGQNFSVHINCVPDNFESEAVYSSIMQLNIPAGNSEASFSLDMPDVNLWYPWDRGDADLYKVTITLSTDREIASYQTLFGFRSIEIDAQFNWKVNDQPYFPRGSNYIASQWLSETIFPVTANSRTHPFPPPVDVPMSDQQPDMSRRDESWFERDVRLMKAANLNIIRVHAHVLPAEFYEVCDRNGLMVWQDFPFQWGYSDDAVFQTEAERQILAMTTLHFNHPAIVVWCVHNESPWDADWMAEEAGGSYDPNHNRSLDQHLEEQVKQLDPTRYVHRNSGTGDQHIYPGWYFGHWRDYQETGELVLPSEYGAQGLPSTHTIQHIFKQFGLDAGHAELQRFRTWLDEQPVYADYRKVPAVEEVPLELRNAREVWNTWRFHNFQPPETFHNANIDAGNSLSDLVSNSQDYQAWINQFGTENIRRNKGKVKGVFQFMFVEPWPAITWAVLDYWRSPKKAYQSLARAMQPIVVFVDGFYPEVSSMDVLEWKLVVVNDQLETIDNAVCIWTLVKTGGNVSSGKIKVPIPANAVSKPINFPELNLSPGKYHLSLSLTKDEKTISKNIYDFTVI